MSLVQRVWVTLLLIVTVGVVGTAGYVVMHHDKIPNAGAMPGFSDPPSDPPPTAGPSSSSDAQATRLRTVFLGDDYTNGTGASGPAAHWTTQVADALNLDAQVVAEDNAGYAAPGIDNTSYLGLIQKVVAAQPDLIVVSGGRNDAEQSPAALNSAAGKLFQKLHARLPQARIIAIAPFWGDSPHPQKLQKVDTAVKNAVKDVRGSYLNVKDPLVGHPGWMANDADPNDQGYAKIAAAITGALRARLGR